jgi:GNAT superfamily N-acetyltransferase
MGTDRKKCHSVYLVTKDPKSQEIIAHRSINVFDIPQKNEAIIYNTIMAVDSLYRGKGHATKLTDAAEKIAQKEAQERSKEVRFAFSNDPVETTRKIHEKRI